ncbi:MAG: hypothetical protein V7711_01495 [Pseudomonadales bacterium]
MPRHFYHLFDQPISTDILLPELEATSSVADALVVQRADFGAEQRPSVWMRQWNEGFVSVARTAEGYWVCYADMVDFLISPDRQQVKYHPAAGLPDASLRHILLDNLLPMVLGDKNGLIIHASAVVLPGGQAVMFCGNSGAGKSTLASYCYTQGAQLLTDDCLLLRQREGRLYCVPNYHGVRLFADSDRYVLKNAYSDTDVSHYTSKRRQAISRPTGVSSASESALAAVFMIDGGNELATEVEAKRVSGLDSVEGMLSQVFSLDPTDRLIASNRFAHIGALGQVDAGFYRLHYPRDYHRLEEAYQAVLATVSKIHSPK